MTDNKYRKIPVWVTGLLIALLALVGIQSAMLYRISDHLKTNQSVTTDNHGSTQQTENTQVADLNTAPLTLEVAPADEWDPFQEMQRMREEMDAMFGDALGRFDPNPGLNQVLGETLALSPQVKISESDDDYTVEVDMSDMGNPNIDTELTGQTLTIHATSDTEIENDGQGSNVATKEHRTESYSRSIMFEQPVQSDGMTQEVEDGVLRVHVPKVHA